ncbi:cytochrome c oxidase accessory protein CcoG [Pseudomonas typographi]|uniref:cytochrome c oxidase accessory protein CcoG n=1 Tax=Pseudomonas typographi TaxID=2715964 RepID=UPI00168304DE|nr:cytochrome c oxidase accessory protein CcoG [Pseudomonas typographi]MBD1588678.1 cytochrome c oxidase accessory protein CcoG [Pseudomonas typographi]
MATPSDKRIAVQALDAEPAPLYAARRKVQPRTAAGRFRRVRQCVGAVLLALFFGLPWLQVEGRQAVWWDLPQRQFHIFSTTFWPQDFILLAGLLIIAAFGLFFATVYAGRLWCGYACPQSVWTWLFLWCEKITEGERRQRLRLDAARWSAGKALRRAAKHGLWLALALATGLAFVAYFSPARALLSGFFTGQAAGWAYFWVALITAGTYLNAGWLREQVCVHMCPYARFQSVMLDRDSLIVAYDAGRGEARGPRRPGSDAQAQGLGDCIDCTLCVQVCPTGIDIRDGLQVACIGCAACVDACDEVMGKMNYPKGLVSYTSERALAGERRSTLRPRLLGYGAVLALMLLALGTALAYRAPVALNVAKDRLLYRENAEGRLENVYRLTVMNKTASAHTYQLNASGLPGLQLHGNTQLNVPARSQLNVVVALSVAPKQWPGSAATVTFHLLDGNTQVAADSRFTGPTP